MIQCGISRQTKYHTLMCPQYLCFNFSTQIFRPADQVSLSLLSLSLLHFSFLLQHSCVQEVKHTLGSSGEMK